MLHPHFHLAHQAVLPTCGMRLSAAQLQARLRLVGGALLAPLDQIWERRVKGNGPSRETAPGQEDEGLWVGVSADHAIHPNSNRHEILLG